MTLFEVPVESKEVIASQITEIMEKLSRPDDKGKK